MILAVGFNPRIGGIIDRPVASATIERARGVSIPSVFVTFSASSVQSSLCDRKIFGMQPWVDGL
jgi:hypothetical protein